MPLSQHPFAATYFMLMITVVKSCVFIAFVDAVWCLYIQRSVVHLTHTPTLPSCGRLREQALSKMTFCFTPLMATGVVLCSKEPIMELRTVNLTAFVLHICGAF